MPTFSREEVLRASGARSEDLEELEMAGLIVPVRPRRWLRRGEPRFTEAQLLLLRLVAEGRRSAGAP
jgi:hypothetical protein